MPRNATLLPLRAAVVAFGLMWTANAHAQIAFSIFTDPHPVVSGGVISISYAGDKFVGSVQRDGTGALFSTDLTGGNVQVFAPTASLLPTAAAEHFLASSLGLGGFPSRDVYAASGNGVLHITHDGSSSNSFVSGLNGSVRGILFDSIGTFGHDMLVTTTSGSVYRVNSAGVATPLASTGEDTEGLDVAPLGGNFGSFDGDLIVASEGSGTIRAIDPSGTVSTVIGGIAGAEELTFVPLNLGASGDPVEGFYGANYTPNVVKAGVDQFHNGLVDYRGDVVVTGEFDHNVNLIKWNGSSFVTSVIGTFPNQPEDGIFVTAGIIHPGPGVPEPGAATMLGGMLAAGLVFVRRRRR